MGKLPFKKLDGSVTRPQGFLTGSVFCDIKKLGTGKGSNKGNKNDLAVIVSEKPAVVAGMFTTNQIVAAPVTLSIPRAEKSHARAIVVNSGNANACTGNQGWLDATEMAALTAKELDLESEDDVLVCSTGRIGIELPMPNVRKGIHLASSNLSSGVDADLESAKAIMTSDNVPKQSAVEISLSSGKVIIGGMTKGAGMIHPGMSPDGTRPASIPLHATMLCFITSDCRISPRIWKSAIKEAVASSFNKISVDGDMSTNDTVIGLANGMAGNKSITSLKSEDGQKLLTGLKHVCLELAKMIVLDGEGVTKLVKLNISGARNDIEADAAARSIANSELVKTSWCGGDPNWGRIAHAIGYSSATVDINKLDIGYSILNGKKISYSIKGGTPAKTSLDSLRKFCQRHEFEIHCNLNLGQGSTEFYTSDLTEEYVDFNKGE